MADAQLEAYDKNDGALVWHHPFERYVPKSLVADVGRIFVAEAAVYALDSKSGQVEWRVSIDGNAALCSPVVLEGVLYVGTSTHKLYALNAMDGKALWSQDLEPDAKYAAVVTGVAGEGAALFVSLQKWRTQNGSESSAVLYKLDSRSGKQIWRMEEYSANEGHGFSSAPMITEGLVLESDFASNSIFAFDSDTGSEKWRFEGERGFAGFSESPHVDGTTVYAASPDTFVYAINLSNGKLIWRAKMPGSNLALGVCEDHLVVSYQRLALLDKNGGKVSAIDIQLEHNGSISSKIAVENGAAFVAGPRAVYKFACR